nr:hypothetical protein CFP56_14318 [Quercus suber]
MRATASATPIPIIPPGPKRGSCFQSEFKLLAVALLAIVLFSSKDQRALSERSTINWQDREKEMKYLQKNRFRKGFFQFLSEVWIPNLIAR